MLAAAISASVLADSFFDDFSTMVTGSCYPDGSVIGVWQFVYNGYGCNAFVTSNSNTMLFQQPQASTRPDETHAALVVGPMITGDFTMEASTATTRQLRTNSGPNPWEVAWILWHYTDDLHFYYFVAKPNGWELGKEDPAYSGAQRFLATGSSPSFPIGPWYRIGVAQTGDTIKVFVNDLLIAIVTDRERPYSSGRVGLYSEDAEVFFDNVSLNIASRGSMNHNDLVRPFLTERSYTTGLESACTECCGQPRDSMRGRTPVCSVYSTSRWRMATSFLRNRVHLQLACGLVAREDD
jgi:hypothetical protein